MLNRDPQAFPETKPAPLTQSPARRPIEDILTPKLPLHHTLEAHEIEDSDNDDDSRLIDQLETLQKLLALAQQNEISAINRAKNAEKQLASISEKLQQSQQLLSEKDITIDKLLDERNLACRMADSLEKSNQISASSLIDMTEQLKELQEKHEKEVNDIYAKHQRDFDNSVRRHKVAIKKQHDMLKEKDVELAKAKKEISVLQAANQQFSAPNNYTRSTSLLFREPRDHRSQEEHRTSLAEAKKHHRG